MTAEAIDIGAMRTLERVLENTSVINDLLMKGGKSIAELVEMTREPQHPKM